MKLTKKNLPDCVICLNSFLLSKDPQKKFIDSPLLQGMESLVKEDEKVRGGYLIGLKNSKEVA